MSEVRVEHLHKEFKGTVAIDDLSFRFEESKVTCLLGPSGCGKTTLLRMIAGLEEVTAGEIYFGSQRVTDLPPRKREIGMVFQYPVVYKGISVYRNIELPLLQERLSQLERKKRIDTVMEMLDLAKSADKDITQLDNVTRQKVAVARAVARQPKIILFDEPITNVDTNAKLQFKRAFKELTQQLKQTIIYVTHDQTEAMTLADRIALMKDGRILQCDTPRTLYSHPEDVFGGWFLGNPGMNFFAEQCEFVSGGHLIRSPLFKHPVRLESEVKVSGGKVTLGIRPEQIRLSSSPTPTSVKGTIVRKSIAAGGQYLLKVMVEGLSLKVKVSPEMGAWLHTDVWVEAALEQVILFDSNGCHLPSSLTSEQPLYSEREERKVCP
ncbi:ABC transporter ATP-binding protein [Brevibacillus choshinensis]|uniref:ABC transporter ATP-binding protein n=1 Tax=Brevibacillus choshinensis TaxID=54911 RepID=UPI002E2261A9|nr:ABC transporter ATP-binding protein [Brevibacillus choshinensis]